MHRPIAVLTVVASILVVTTPAAAAASPGFVVSLHDDGDADLRVTYTFDLAGDAEREAFQELRANETARGVYADRFGDRLSGIAGDAATETGREMRVSDVALNVSVEDDVGVVTITATWHGLAAAEDDRLVVAEPFASGFEPDRPVTVAVPDGYAVEEVSPSPDERSDGRLTWHADRSLSGFSLTAAPADDGVTTGLGPGFGLAAALLAVLLAALAVRGRR